MCPSGFKSIYFPYSNNSILTYEDYSLAFLDIIMYMYVCV